MITAPLSLDCDFIFSSLNYVISVIFPEMFKLYVVYSGPEYGTTASAWKGVLAEAESMAEIHLRIKDNLIQEVESKITAWKKENYKKSAIGPSKETKHLEDEFKKVRTRDHIFVKVTEKRG